MSWKVIYHSIDQTIEQRVVDGEIEERVTWHRDTPERVAQKLTEQVADLEAQATGRISKAQLEAKLEARKVEPVKDVPVIKDPVVKGR